MTKAEGEIRINGVATGEVAINLLGPSVGLSVKYALCNTLTGEKFGAGQRNQNWSDETLTKLAELVDSIERDVIQDVFVDASTISTVAESDPYDGDGTPGL